MECYITFIRNVMSGEEMVSTRFAPANAHEEVLRQEMRAYPAPKYRVHTTYTEEELSDTLESVRRLSGATPATKLLKSSVASKGVGFKTGLSF